VVVRTRPDASGSNNQGETISLGAWAVDWRGLPSTGSIVVAIRRGLVRYCRGLLEGQAWGIDKGKLENHLKMKNPSFNALRSLNGFIMGIFYFMKDLRRIATQEKRLQKFRVCSQPQSFSGIIGSVRGNPRTAAPQLPQTLRQSESTPHSRVHCSSGSAYRVRPGHFHEGRLREGPPSTSFGDACTCIL